LLCAQRELREETGYGAKQWSKLTSMYSTPGICNEILHIYLAAELSPHEMGQELEEGEASLTVNRVPIREAIAMIEREEIVDGKTIAGILLGARKLGIA
ncbi:MAG: NUDIX hydrolase, partial [Bacteroidota bacterium]